MNSKIYIKYLKYVFYILVIVIFWFGLRWYFILPRVEYLGSFECNNNCYLNIFKKLNFSDAEYSDYDYSISSNKDTNFRESGNTFWVELGELELSDFKFEKNKFNSYLIVVYETRDNKEDTLIKIDNSCKVIYRKKDPLFDMFR